MTEEMPMWNGRKTRAGDTKDGWAARPVRQPVKCPPLESRDAYMARVSERGMPCAVVPTGWPDDRVAAGDPLTEFQARFGADWFRD